MDIPVYDFVTSARTAQSIPIAKADVVLVDGILIFYHPGGLRPALIGQVLYQQDVFQALISKLAKDIAVKHGHCMLIKLLWKAGHGMLDMSHLSLISVVWLQCKHGVVKATMFLYCCSVHALSCRIGRRECATATPALHRPRRSARTFSCF